jgi:hypothetical protein
MISFFNYYNSLSIGSGSGHTMNEHSCVTHSIVQNCVGGGGQTITDGVLQPGTPQVMQEQVLIVI